MTRCQVRGAVKAPEFSHSPNRAYAIIQNGRLKHISFYGANHKQLVSIDFLHDHNGIKPHKHYDLDHGDSGIPITEHEKKFADRIRKEFNVL